MNQQESGMLTFWEQRVIIRQAVLRMPLKLMLMVLHDYAGANGTAFPGQKRLANDLGCTVRSVQRFLRELSETGLIEIDAHRGFCNRYRLRFPMIANCIPDRTEKGEVKFSVPAEPDIPIPPPPSPVSTVVHPTTAPSASPDRSVVHNIQRTSIENPSNIQDENSLNLDEGCSVGLQEGNDSVKMKGTRASAPPQSLLPTTDDRIQQRSRSGEKARMRGQEKPAHSLTHSRVKGFSSTDRNVCATGSKNRNEPRSTQVNPTKQHPPKKHAGCSIDAKEFSQPFFAEVRFREAVSKGWCHENDRLRYFSLWEYVSRHTTDPKLQGKLKNPPAFFMDSLKKKQWHAQHQDEARAQKQIREIDQTMEARQRRIA